MHSTLYIERRTVTPVYLAIGMSHNLIVLSSPLDASVLPSGLKTTDCTASLCPLSVASSFFVAMSQSLTVLSPLANANVLPSGLNATEFFKVFGKIPGPYCHNSLRYSTGCTR